MKIYTYYFSFVPLFIAILLNVQQPKEVVADFEVLTTKVEFHPISEPPASATLTEGNSCAIAFFDDFDSNPEFAQYFETVQQTGDATGVVKAWDFIFSSSTLRIIPDNLAKVDILKTSTFNYAKFLDYLKATFNNVSTEAKKKGFFNKHFNPQDVGGKKLFGDFVGDEIGHTTDIMTQKGYTSAFFEKNAPGIEGFLFKSGSSPLPVSLKNLPNANFNTIIGEVDDVVSKVNSNISRYKGSLVTGSNSNTLFELKIGQFTKSEFKNLLDTNPNKFLNNSSTKSMFNEVKFIFNDGSVLRYDTGLNLL